MHCNWCAIVMSETMIFIIIIIMLMLNFQKISQSNVKLSEFIKWTEIWRCCVVALFPSRLPSIADRHPFVLLRLVYSENEHVHQLALKALVKYSHRWSGSLALVYGTRGYH